MSSFKVGCFITYNYSKSWTSQSSSLSRSCQSSSWWKYINFLLILFRHSEVLIFSSLLFYLLIFYFWTFGPVILHHTLQRAVRQNDCTILNFTATENLQWRESNEWERGYCYTVIYNIAFGDTLTYSIFVQAAILFRNNTIAY